jgi:hypothetical protein
MANIEFTPPIKGINKGVPADRPMPVSSEYMNNVRPIDVSEKRIRIGQRPGLDKWSATQVGGAENPVVAICVVASVI